MLKHWEEQDLFRKLYKTLSSPNSKSVKYASTLIQIDQQDRKGGLQHVFLIRKTDPLKRTTEA